VTDFTAAQRRKPPGMVSELTKTVSGSRCWQPPHRGVEGKRRSCDRAAWHHFVVTTNATAGIRDALRSIGDSIVAGDLAKASDLCARAMRDEAPNSDVHYLAGLIALTRADPHAAIPQLRKAIELDAGQSLYHHVLGRALASVGAFADAASAFARAIELEPARADTRLELASLHLSMGNADGAREACRLAGGLPALDDESLSRLGNLLAELDDHAAAADARRVLAERNPHSAQAHVDLGTSLFQAGDEAGAVRALDTAVRLAPHSAVAWFNYGVAAQATGAREIAAEAYRRAVTLDPGHVDATMGLGVLLQSGGDLEGARMEYESALRESPANARVLFNLGMTLDQLGEEEAAERAFRQSAEHGGNGLYRVLHLLSLPRIIPAEGLTQHRLAFEERLDELSRCRLSLAELSNLGTSWFCLAYHGRNNRALLEKLCASFRSACPALDLVAPHCDAPFRSERIRVGFVSNHLHSHTVGLYFAAFIQALDARQFEVIIFSQDGPEDSVSRDIRRHAGEHVRLGRNFETAREQIAGKRLDVLVYPDIGMEPMSYFMAFARLARVQICLYGHPETTGIDTIDFFLSHAGCEGPDSAGWYSERLLLLPEQCAYACFPRPDARRSSKTREQFGFPAGRLLLTCPQAPHKIHPDFDRMADRILREEPRAQLALVHGGPGRLMEQVLRRMSARMGERARRITILPRQGFPDYLALVSCSDVVLDTPHFNGGKTTFDAIAMRRPVVTIPGHTLKSRQTAHLLDRLGLPQLVAATAEEYAQTAVAVAGSAREQARIAEAIRSADGRVFGDPGSTDAFRRLLLGVCEGEG